MSTHLRIKKDGLLQSEESVPNSQHNLIATEAYNHKYEDLQKSSNHAKLPTISTAARESNTDSKKDSEQATATIAPTVKSDFNNKEAFNSIKGTIKLKKFDELYELTNQHSKVTSSSTSTTQNILEPMTGGLANIPESIIFGGFGLPTNKTKIPCKPCALSVTQMSELLEKDKALFKMIKCNNVSESKIASLHSEDIVQQKSVQSSISRLLNIQGYNIRGTNMETKKLCFKERESNTIEQPDEYKKYTAVDCEPKSNNTNDAIEEDDILILHNNDPNVVCECNLCKQWTSINMASEEPTLPDHKKLKPPLLFNPKNYNNEVVIKEFNSEIKYRSEMLLDCDIMVHGINFPKPIRSTADAFFNPVVYNALGAFNQAYGVQCFAWPALLRKMNMCMVSAHKTGKTMGYLPVMCSFLIEQYWRYRKLITNTKSPLVVILCPGASVADEVYDLTYKLIAGIQNQPKVALVVPPMDKTCLNQFQRQCDLLITTPIMIHNLLDLKIITLKRVCHLVLEDADVLFDKFPGKMNKFLDLVNDMLKHRNYSYSVQLVAVSEHWTTPLENLVKRLQCTPLICIGSDLEAALYGRLRIQIHFVEARVKQFMLCDLLKTDYQTCRTVVICTKDEQVHELKETFQIMGLGGLFVNNKIEKNEVEEIEMKWLATLDGKHLVFVCTDAIFNGILKLRTAVSLVHYSLPTTPIQFSARFNSLLQNYNSPLNKKKQNGVHCKTHIFVDEICKTQYSKLFPLLTRMGCVMSTQCHKDYEASLIEKENQNISSKVAICRKLRQMGQCMNLKCSFRHKLSYDLDYSNNLPKSGSIKFEILRVHSVTTYTVKLLEHTDLDGKTYSCVKYPNLHADLQKVMKKQKHAVGDVCLNTSYVYQSCLNGVYRRCIVKKFINQESILKSAQTVHVKFIDAGFYSKVSVADLFEMPEEFQRIPPQGVMMYLANLVPPNFDDSFSIYSKNKVSKLINTLTEGDKAYCCGYIVLQLGNTIWIDNMCIIQDLLITKTMATTCNLSKYLCKENIASTSNAPLSNLYELCSNADIKLPNITKLEVAISVTFEEAATQY